MLNADSAERRTVFGRHRIFSHIKTDSSYTVDNGRPDHLDLTHSPMHDLRDIVRRAALLRWVSDALGQPLNPRTLV